MTRMTLLDVREEIGRGVAAAARARLNAGQPKSRAMRLSWGEAIWSVRSYADVQHFPAHAKLDQHGHVTWTTPEEPPRGGPVDRSGDRSRAREPQLPQVIPRQRDGLGNPTCVGCGWSPGAHAIWCRFFGQGQP